MSMKKTEKSQNIFSKLTSIFKNTPEQKSKNIYNEISGNEGFKTYFHDVGKPVWMSRNYSKFAEEGYIKNVIAFKSINMIAKSIASIPFKTYEIIDGKRHESKSNEVLNILKLPNPFTNSSLFIETLLSHKIISGNSYILAVKSPDGTPLELHILRPDRLSILTDRQGYISHYIYEEGGKKTKYKVDKFSGKCDILHLKNFHPTNDHYGLSPIEAAAYSIDQHNQSAMWNQALLQNGAKPSGALVVKPQDEGGLGSLTDDQFLRISKQIEEQFTGHNNAGKPIVLEGGMDWKELSLSPKDMDFIKAKDNAAREIALAFGVPPQMLGIPGDNTYSNMKEARLAFWEQTVIPLIEEMASALNNWLVPMFNMSDELEISYELNSIDALSPKREDLWKRISDADFLSAEEKREILKI